MLLNAPLNTWFSLVGSNHTGKLALHGTGGLIEQDFEDLRSAGRVAQLRHGMVTLVSLAEHGHSFVTGRT